MPECPSLEQDAASTTTTLEVPPERPEAWLCLPHELRFIIYDLVAGASDIDCCGCPTFVCEFEDASNCKHNPYVKCQKTIKMTTLVNPRLNMMLISKGMFEDVKSIIPPTPVTAIFHGLRCAFYRLHRGSKPALLTSISAIVYKVQRHARAPAWHRGQFQKQLEEVFGHVRQVGNKETLDEDKELIIDLETTYQVVRVLSPDQRDAHLAALPSENCGIQ